MARAQKSHNRGNSSVTRKRRTSIAGKILPPLDVRSTKSLSELEKRIKKGPLTIVMIYADWCGHCHTMMPHFDAASKTPNRSVQSVKINEAVLNQVNSHMSKNMGSSPIKVEGYPSIIMVNKNGEKVSDIETVRSTPTMTKLMEQSGKLAEEAGLADAESIESKANSNAKESEEESMRIESAARRNNELLAPTPINSFSAPKNSSKLSKSDIDSIGTLTSTTAITDIPATPPTSESDINMGERVVNSNAQRGGNLYSAITKSAYQLAPAAVLLGIASGMQRKTMQRKTMRNKRRARFGISSNRKTHKKTTRRR